MRVLVTAASRHGATVGLATELGARIRELVDDPTVRVDVRPIAAVANVHGYDAVVLGSVLYLGRWLAPAREFAAAHADDLRDVPVWLFSSGPVGDPPTPDEQHAVDLTPVLSLVTPVSQRTFAGRLDRDRLGFAERAAVQALHVQAGDFRDWAAVRRWAAEISEHLAIATSQAGTQHRPPASEPRAARSG